jgi:short-subunit dehydrogenase
MPLNQPITQWQGRSVWLIGASSGIGLATAKALHAAGARVTVSARKTDLLHTFVASHAGSQAIALDVCDAQAVHAVAQQVAQTHEIDVVVYCSGYYKAVRATKYSLEEMTYHQDVNYLGVARVLDAVLPILLDQKRGHISLIASVAGYSGLPNSLAYGPTKAAMINLAESLYFDLSPIGIGVSVVNPGFVATPLTAQNKFAMPALLQPEVAAAYMLKGWADGEFEIHYPKRFSRWLKFMRLLPYRWYFGLVRSATKM